MKNFLKKLPLILCMASFMTTAKADEELINNSMKDLTLVVGSGIAGAVIGLSTLAFVDEPSDHLKNIVVGGAVGVIVGVGIVAFTQATKTNDIYQNAFFPQETKGLTTLQRRNWSHTEFNRLTPKKVFSPVSFSFSL